MVPIVTSTSIDESNPVSITKAFLDAINQGQYSNAADLISSYSMLYFDTTKDRVTRDLPGAFDNSKQNYADILNDDVEPINDTTVWVHVHFTGDLPLLDCCVLVQEEGKWRINLWRAYHRDPSAGDYLGFIKDNTYLGFFVDFLQLKAEGNSGKNGLRIEPISIARYTRLMVFTYSITNNTDNCFTWGSAHESLMYVEFEQEPEPPMMSAVFIPERYVSSASGEQFPIPGFKHSYPKRIEMHNWRISANNGCNVVDKSNIPFLYNFSLK